MFKYYYYEVAVQTRPEGTMQPVVGIVTQFAFTSPENALNAVKASIERDYEVNYGYFVREFRRIK